MKSLIYTLIAAFALSGTVFAAAGFAKSYESAPFAATAHDLPTFLRYHPTDGDSQAGKVRRALDLTHIQ